MSYTRQQWVTDVLKGLGNTNPSQALVNWVIGWTNYETAVGQSAAYNLLNTTQKATGATDYNSVGVKNYTSYSQGIQATVQTLSNGLYPQLLNDLKTGNINDLISSPLVTHEIGIWGTGKSGARIAQASNHGAQDVFSGVSTGTPIGNVVNTAQQATGAVFALLGLAGSNSVNKTGLQIGQLPSISLSPNASVVQILEAIDVSLALVNPFFVQGTQLDTLGFLGQGLSFTDPISYIEGFGLNLVEDFVALIVRFILLLIGVFILIKVLMQFVDVSQVGSQALSTIAQLAPLAA